MLNTHRKIWAKITIVALFAAIVAYLPVYTFAATTTPATINYQGRLLDSSNDPLAGNYDFRFSIWSNADLAVGDIDGVGAINIAAPNYGGWQESHSVTTGTFGLFNIDLGSITGFPNFTSGTHQFLQVEVKSTGQPDTSYEILDPQGTLADLIDRKTIHKQAYAENADTIDNAEIGTSAGDIAILGAGGVWDIARIPGGTDVDSFIIDFNDSAAGNILLQLGNDGTDATITFDDASGNTTLATAGGNFSFSDDNISTTGDITTSGLTGSGAINFSTGSQFRIPEANDPNTNSACSHLRQLIFNTANNQLMRCTGIGAAGIATWTNVDTTGGAVDFEGTYVNDADNTLTTSNGDFTVNAGTGDFIITSNDWGVDASGNITTNGTVDGVDLSNLNFSNLATRVKEFTLEPEYDGGVIETDGTSNRGKLIYDFIDLGGAAKRNFYEWNTRNAAIQDIDLVISLILPQDFVSFTGTPIELDYQTSNGVNTTNEVELEVFDTTGTAIALNNAADLANANWTTSNITFVGVPTFNAGDKITLKIKLATTNNGFARVSDLVLNYNGR